MFVDRAAEDLRLGNRRQGLLDLFFERASQSAPARKAAEAATRFLARIFSRPAALAVNLGPGKTMSFTADGRCRIDVKKGRVWVTARGSVQDYALGEGGRLELAGARRAVITAMESEARVIIRWR